MPLAVITGASSGIGMELAKIMANDGHDLVLVARREEKLRGLQTELEASGQRIEVLAHDLSQNAAGKSLYEELKRRDLDCEILINNAGFGKFGPFHENDWKLEQEMIQLNILTLTELSKLFIQDRLQKNQAGHLMNVASTAAFQPGPMMAVYYATKSYVLSFSEAIANELRDTEIKVTVLCPGPTKSEFQDRASMSNAKIFNSPLVATSEDVASYGYQAMKAGKTLAIQGFSNRIGAFSSRILPRSVMTNLVRTMTDKGGAPQKAN